MLSSPTEEISEASPWEFAFPGKNESVVSGYRIARLKNRL